MAKDSKKHETEVPETDTEQSSSPNHPETEVSEEAPQSHEEIVQEMKDQNLRLYAEFENFRRRNARERLDLMATANEKVIKAVLPIVDDFERALKNIAADSPERVGMELIYTKLMHSLKAEGLTEMDSSIGKVFDVETMEAITNIPAPSPDMAGKVIDQIEKGYSLGVKIIRYAKVVVADQSPT
ncbi:MAG: nucleotide exchange factor GrpE [Schleiferiaceae bacterium]|nr:nucleotide exchange factor GrpE [Schleiferiaceae bacterium]